MQSYNYSDPLYQPRTRESLIALGSHHGGGGGGCEVSLRGAPPRGGGGGGGGGGLSSASAVPDHVGGGGGEGGGADLSTLALRMWSKLLSRLLKGVSTPVANHF